MLNTGWLYNNGSRLYVLLGYSKSWWSLLYIDAFNLNLHYTTYETQIVAILKLIQSLYLYDDKNN